MGVNVNSEKNGENKLESPREETIDEHNSRTTSEVPLVTWGAVSLPKDRYFIKLVDGRESKRLRIVNYRVPHKKRPNFLIMSNRLTIELQEAKLSLG